MPDIKNYIRDIVRMADWLENNRVGEIKDRSSFDAIFQTEMTKGEELTGFLEQLADKTFDKLRETQTQISSQRLQQKESGIGRFRKQPRPQAGAVALPKEFGVSKGRVVRIKSREVIKIRGKEQVKFRNSKGQFAKVN